MPVTRLRLNNLGAFQDIDFSFDSNVNVFTGPNNSGKSTVLWALGELLVYPFSLPEKLLHGSRSKWLIDADFEGKSFRIEGSFPAKPSDMLPIYPDLGHSCYIPAQRYSSSFRPKGPTATRSLEATIDGRIAQLVQSHPSVLERKTPEHLRQLASHWTEQSNPELAKRERSMLSSASLMSDEALIQKIIDLDYASYRRERSEIRQTVDQIATIASEITEGFPVQFLDIREDKRGLYPAVKTPSGEIPIDSLSQGTLSIIYFLSHLIFGYTEYYGFVKDVFERPGVAVIDEIDAHLHPAWQRRMIPTLRSHFPNLQLFCSTHSPLLLGGLQTGQVHLLRQGSDGKISASTNELDIFGWSADDILRNILELHSATDVATEQRLRRLQELRQSSTLTSDEHAELEALRDAVAEGVLTAPMELEIDRFTEELRRIRERRSLRTTDKSEASDNELSAP